MLTRARILDSAALEIERNGMTQFRVKRVASEAGVSVALLYSYFDDREDLIAETIVHRYCQVLLGLVEIFTKPLEHVQTTADLRAALRIMIAEAQIPERTEARILRIEGISFAKHNPSASAGIAGAKKEASARILRCVQPLEDKNLLVDGMSAVAFARIWYALFFGQIALEGEHALSIDPEDWLKALHVLSDSAIRAEYSDLAF
jgi:AcrR family transcriptional regulator